MAAAAAAAAAIAQATKASGVIVKLEPAEFEQLVLRMQSPLIVFAEAGIFSTKYQYLTSYKGLALFTSSKTPLHLPDTAEIITANKIWVPD